MTVRENIDKSFLQGFWGDQISCRDVISLLHFLQQAEVSQMNWFKISVSSFSRFPNIDFVLQRYKFVCWTWNVFISTLVQMFIFQFFWARASLSMKQCVIIKLGIFCFTRNTVSFTRSFTRSFTVSFTRDHPVVLNRVSTGVLRQTGWEPLIYKMIVTCLIRAVCELIFYRYA